MRDTNLVNALREHAEWAQANEWETPITLGDDLVEAADRIANQNTHILALQKEIEGLRGQLDLRRCALCDYWLGEADPRCMCGKSPWGGKTMQKDNYCSHWQRHTDWIPVTERLPELQSWGASEVVLGLIKSEDVPSLNKLHNLTLCVYCDNGIWSMPGRYVAITHWMPLPEPPEEEK